MTDTIKGYVYLISNPESMPGLIKIGFTKNKPEERLSQLFSTGVPTPFTLEHVYKIRATSPAAFEKSVHSELNQFRVHPNREFFRIGVDEARERISIMLNTSGKNYRTKRQVVSVCKVVLTGLIFWIALYYVKELDYMLRLLWSWIGTLA